MKNRFNKAGFTLIELSIVLVIIGLIVGGVLMGRDLIKAAQLRSLSSQLIEFETAISTFRLKYNCLPGDCADATGFFGTDSGGCPAGSNGDGTCNGNGDGFLGNAASTEVYRFWQHLGMSKLIAGSYTGVTEAGAGCGGACNATAGVNVPIPEGFDNGGYYTFTMESTDSGNFYSARKATFLSVGGESVSYHRSGLISGEDMKSIDLKIDDGLIISGRVSAWKLTACANNFSSDTLATYNLSDGTLCALVYYLKI